MQQLTDADAFIKTTFAEISPKLVNTERGPRFLRKVPAMGPDFWQANKPILNPKGVSMSKDKNTGKWEMCLWTDPASDPFSAQDTFKAPIIAPTIVPAAIPNVARGSGIRINGYELYQYQADSMQAAINSMKISDGAAGIIVAPTGAGKTVIAMAITRRALDEDIVDVVLIVDHRLDLSRQNAPKIGAEWVGNGRDLANLTIRKGSVILISAQILQREQNLAILKQKIGDLRVLGIFDEAHHYVAAKWGDLLEIPDVYVGLTATPFRSDKKSVVGAFEKIIYKISYSVLWAAKKLAPMRLRYVDTTVKIVARKTRDDLEVVEINGEDEKVREDVILAEINARDADEGKPELKGLLFANNLETAERIVDQLNASDVPAAIVSYKVPSEEREQIFEQLRSGEIRVLANYEVLTEGFDEPTVNTVFFARPTRSEKVAIQCIGRGLRIDPANPDKKCEVVMFADKIADADDPDAIIEGVDVSEAFAGVPDQEGAIDEIAIDADVNPKKYIRESRRVPGPKNTSWFRVDGKWFSFVGLANSFGGNKRYVLFTITETPEYKLKGSVVQWRNVKVGEEWKTQYVEAPKDWFLGAAPGDKAMFPEVMAGVSLAGKDNFERMGISPARIKVLEREYGPNAVRAMPASEKLFRIAAHFNEIL